MHSRKNTFFFVVCIFVILSCSRETSQQNSKIITNDDLLGYYFKWQEKLNESIINDFFSPPVASRIYLYSNLSINATVFNKSDSLSLLPFNPTLLIDHGLDKELASLFTFYFTSRELMFTSDILDNYYFEFKKKLELEGLNEDVIAEYEKRGKEVAESVLNYASKDNYKQSRSYKKYEIKNVQGCWSPTPPDYSDGLEPFWSKIKAICLDSSSQFRPQKPTEYSEDEKSQFVAELNEVYSAASKNPESNEISKYWDCNPVVLKHGGHTTISEKKLTPGGHWLSICSKICRKEKLSFKQTTYITTALSIGIFDGFISCWEAKYYYNYIRPITAIVALVDPEWKPLLLTPNFPEYPSGHSVISGTSSEILTHFFGNNFRFVDSTVVKFGNQPRSFNSFYEARDEAAISRLYGGIHFMPAINNGKIQGQNIGKFVIKKIKLKSL
ncbi:MAG: vanadium-dependent haloperoxidase [Bacteroidota bacterium]|nr:vanadium-dependent haloperoxidase [Bacteroidota bacterium]